MGPVRIGFEFVVESASCLDYVLLRAANAAGMAPRDYDHLCFARFPIARFVLAILPLALVLLQLKNRLT